ncbi:MULTISPECIES: hypothetical protein [Olivibacter]|uniref:TspO/MBR related protein n=2 Tax=Olivibacter TaxID=376469 RepID=A0ABV6HIY0_9SPHI|nr:MULTISPECIES: hypothetical protein [Olivibacter]MCL4638878.1 hypothetical protein [Olivibacter sp. UJ_SKK_5.1]MDM8174901.1 hypothetical protein [Olivibacter sp. 47]MDX3913420.1 hypothetical protein [Pseudosphingobacterium sp.]QEL01685.1 hypothetical protein FKG96_12990 [Olivibacter sp. LS-1]
MRYIRQLAIINFISYCFAFLISMLGQTRDIGGYTMGEMSAKYESGITPAAFTFSIWSVIYTALFLMLIVHLIKAFSEQQQFVTNQEVFQIGFSFSINQLAIATWVYTWLNDIPGLSLVLLLVQLFTLYYMAKRLQLLIPQKGKLSLFITQLPLSIYFGWITIACLANFAAWLVSLGWLANPAVDLYVSYALLLTAAVLGTVTVYFKHNIFYGLIIIWGIYGILMKRFEEADPYFHSLIYVGAFGIILILLAIIRSILNYSNTQKRTFLSRK